MNWIEDFAVRNSGSCSSHLPRHTRIRTNDSDRRGRTFILNSEFLDWCGIEFFLYQNCCWCQIWCQVLLEKKLIERVINVFEMFFENNIDLLLTIVDWRDKLVHLSYQFTSSNPIRNKKVPRRIRLSTLWKNRPRRKSSNTLALTARFWCANFKIWMAKATCHRNPFTGRLYPSTDLFDPSLGPPDRSTAPDRPVTDSDTVQITNSGRIMYQHL